HAAGRQSRPRWPARRHVQSPAVSSLSYRHLRAHSWCGCGLSILPKLAIECAAIKPVNCKPVPKRLQFSVRIVDLVILLEYGHQPLGNMDDREMLAQGEKRLWATTLFDWRCPRAGGTDRIGLRRIERQNLLKADLMSPEIAKVVFVGKTLVRA